MNNSLINFANQLEYLYSHLTISQVLDMTLVAGLIFVVFQALYQTHTLQILRGVITVAFLGGALLVLLPLNTFSWFVRLLLLAGVIALPFLFQDELRRLLVLLGQFGRQRSKIPDFERFKQSLIQTASQLSDQATGGLIVLEGQTIIEDIIETGVRMDAGVITPELLVTIFHPRTPLHDGAVVVRGDQLTAAGCILPVQTGDMADSHLGTRHRAGLGLSVKVPDALVIIISEETGRISIAHNGMLHLGLSLKELEDWIVRFGEQVDLSKKVSWGWIIGGGIRQSVVNFLTAILLAVIAWLIVVFQTNPPQQTTLQDVPLAVEGLANGLIVTNDLPEYVNVIVQTTQDRLDDVSGSSVLTTINLAGYSEGVFSVPIQAAIPDATLGSAYVKPAVLDVILEPESSKQITPTVTITDLNLLAAGYLISEIDVNPPMITLSGAKSLLEQAYSANINLELSGRQGTFQQSAVPVIVDNNGKSISGLTINPEKVFLTVTIVRSVLTKEVGVQPEIDRQSLDPYYEITGVEIDPTTVTLTGSSAALAAVDSFLTTAPISLTHQISDISLPVALIVPEGITVLNDQGTSIRSVSARVQISPVSGYLVLQKNIQLLNNNADLSVQLSESFVSLLLVGPQVLLDKINTDPQLVTVSIDLKGLPSGSYALPPSVELPEGVNSQSFPKEVEVVINSR